MTNEIDTKTKTEDGDEVAKDEKNDPKTDIESKEPREGKQRTVSFNKDVHVKRFGKPREARGTSLEYKPPIRKEPFTNHSEQELIEEANKVLEQAGSVTCTADHPPEKFYSLPHRKKLKEDRSERRNSDDAGEHKALGRSTSDVGSKKRRERTSLSTLYRRAQKNNVPVVVKTKPVTIVKRSKSDTSDLKSNTNLNINPKIIRKRSGSETEEFLKSLRNPKCQLSPIIESSPREDYFKKTSPLDIFQKQNNLEQKSINTVNPLEKPPRTESLLKPVPKPPAPPVRTKRAKSAEDDKERLPFLSKTTKQKSESNKIKKTISADEIDSKSKYVNPSGIKNRIKDSIRKIQENIYGDKEMIHSSQQPPVKPPLTRGNTVDHLVRILREDQLSPSPKPHLISPPHGTNGNQPFSYIKPSVSPDPHLFTRNISPERFPSQINKMNDKGAIYAQVIKENGNGLSKRYQKTYSPSREKFGNMSDEDEGLGHEEKYKYNRSQPLFNNTGTDNNDITGFSAYDIHDSPIKPRFREYKLTTFNDFEPTYANEYTSNHEKTDHTLEKLRGRADGMDSKRPNLENEIDKGDLDFNALSHRRKLLESRMNTRRFDRVDTGEPISKYLAETDPIYEATKRMKATEKYVNETAKYYHHTLEKDGFTEDISGEYNKYGSDNNKLEYNVEKKSFQKVPTREIDRRRFLDSLRTDVTDRSFHDKSDFPPEPEYEPPSLEFKQGKRIFTPDEYKEKKYKAKKHFTSSQDVLQNNNQKYKGKFDWFGKKKGHYSSNPEIAQEREGYSNLPYNPKHSESYHNSLRRIKNKVKYDEDYRIQRNDSGNSRDYYREVSPRRNDIDNRLVDSGIENDFRKDSSGEINRVSSRHRRYQSNDDVRNTSVFLDSERRHTEDNYPSEQIYANGQYIARFEDYKPDLHKRDYLSREKSSHDRFDHKTEQFEKSPSKLDENISAKPPKALKKLSGLEKVKQLFSRDSSKKSKKENEVQQKSRTRVLKSPEHLAGDDSEYKRYTDPEPSDVDCRKKDSPVEEPKPLRGSRERLERNRSSDPRYNDSGRIYRDEYDNRYAKTLKEERRQVDRREQSRRYHSSERESDQHSRQSDAESDRRMTRSRTAGPLDSPALAERYRSRRRLATPSPPPAPAPVQERAGWFKSLDRLTRKKDNSTKVDKDSILTSKSENNRKAWSNPPKSSKTPPKNLRFFGDTDQESDTNHHHSTLSKTKSPPSRSHGTLRKTVSNSSTGMDEIDHSQLSNKSYSLTNLHKEDRESPRPNQYYKRNLHNISEIQSNSETESQFGRNASLKPPINPYDRRSRSHSSSKTLKGSKPDVRRVGRNEPNERGSSSELRSSKQDLFSRDVKSRRRAPATNSGESSTEGDSSHHSNRSVVYLHATTVGDIPDPARVPRHRSRDDVSSLSAGPSAHVRSSSKSFSMRAPWTPRHAPPTRDLHYRQSAVPKASSTRNLAERPSTLLKRKSASQTALARSPARADSQLSLDRRGGGGGGGDRVARSVSLSKDGKKAGWFKLSGKTKKPDSITRVR